LSDHTVKSQGGGEKFKRIEDLFGGAHRLVADALQLTHREVPLGRLGGEQAQRCADDDDLHARTGK